MRLGHRKDLICCMLLRDHNGCCGEPVPIRTTAEGDHVEVKDQRVFHLLFAFSLFSFLAIQMSIIVDPQHCWKGQFYITFYVTLPVSFIQERRKLKVMLPFKEGLYFAANHTLRKVTHP